MEKSKILTLVYFAVLLVSVIILSNICVSINSMLGSNPLPENFETLYGSMQKKAGLYGIVAFIILLVISFVLYYLLNKPTYVVLSNIAYVALILLVFVTLNRNYFNAQNLVYNEKSEYWITVFMGIFYIIGSVLVSAIGYITIRNYTKRSKHTLNKSNI